MYARLWVASLSVLMYVCIHYKSCNVSCLYEYKYIMYVCMCVCMYVCMYVRL